MLKKSIRFINKPQYLFSYRNYGDLLKYQPDQNEYKLAGNKASYYVNYCRRYGHLTAQLDPLKLVNSDQGLPSPSEFGLSNDEVIDEITKNQIHNEQINSVEELEQFLKQNYNSSVGIEFEHITDSHERLWLYKNYEKFMGKQLSKGERVNIFSLLTQAEAIDHYMHKKFATFKRYAGEGGEASVIALRAIYAYASEQGVSEIVQSMAHRGRFVQMIALLDFAPHHIFRKIQGKPDIPVEYNTGICDVVHHLSSSAKRRFPGAGCKDEDITISVVHNPSHLEAANPVSQGKTRAKQDDLGQPLKVMNIQLHGDAAFAGQGIVYESLQLNNVNNYSVDGTLHVVLNNQIGYTTNIQDSRSTRYCCDGAKGFGIPIIHVNSEDVETVHKISKFIVEYRNQFKKDILLDLITYRRYGHNEVDEPEFTQPQMYKIIRGQEKGLPIKYFNKLVNEKLISDQDYEKIRDRVFKNLNKEFEKTEEKQTLETLTNEKSQGSKAFTGKWKGMQFSQFALNEHYLKNTGVEKDTLKQYGEQSVKLPNGFSVHPRIQKFFIDDRLDQLKQNSLDWATAESMSFASLLAQGYNVRISGQDVERGTFSQRHAVFTDQKNEEKYNPLKENFKQGRYSVANSILSEAAVMAFDFGYSMESPKNLVIWEAQFGDFYNTGQSIVDTYITCSEEKWMRQSSLVMMLPHGFDGAGPEHSSCRPERWLQAGVNLPVNFQFVWPSTPANVFHMLRRQMLRSYRKPLIVASGKILLKHKKVKSSFEDLDSGTQFEPLLIKNKSNNPKAIIFCSGKISYDIQQLYETLKFTDYNLFTIEELLPFPLEHIKQHTQSSAPIYWVQEEPENAGAFNYIQKYFKTLGREVKYIGRPPIAAVAVGYSQLHNQEGEQILNQLKSIIQ